VNPRPLPRRAGLVGLGFVVVSAVLVRLPLFAVPLDPDEGGYAYIARKWAEGARLYSPAAWVDRPQGLLLAFRAAAAVSYSPAGVRALAVVAAVSAALAATSAAWAIAGRRAGIAAGLVAAVLLAGAFVEGYEFNGEIIAAAVGSWGAVLALWWRAGRIASRWLLAAGLLAASAMLVKQSAVDSVAVVLAVAAVSANRRRALPLAVGGTAIPLGGALLWAAAVGWGAWWFAVVSFQAGVAGTLTLDGRLTATLRTARYIAPDLLGVALGAALGLAVVPRLRHAWWPAMLWATVAVSAVLASPFGNPHYWMQPVLPLAVLLGLAAATVSRRTAVGLVALAVAVPLAVQIHLATSPPASRAAFVVHNRTQLAAPSVAGWLRVHSRPQDTVYAFVAGAEIYLEAGRSTHYPYLWGESVVRIPGAVTRLASWLASPSGPRYVVLYQRPAAVDPTGRLSRILLQHYPNDATVSGYTILQRRR